MGIGESKIWKMVKEKEVGIERHLEIENDPGILLDAIVMLLNEVY